MGDEAEGRAKDGHIRLITFSPATGSRTDHRASKQTTLGVDFWIGSVKMLAVPFDGQHLYASPEIQQL